MRLIDADALKEAFEEDGHLSAYIEELIDEQPTISPDDVGGVGEWEDAQQHGLVRCSVCKDCYIEQWYIKQAKWKYCPNCGAKMEVSEDA